MKLKIMTILLLAGLTGGCMATITPDGNIYTEALVPTSTVVVESYSRPVFVSAPARPRPHHVGPIASRPRPHGHSFPGNSHSPRPGRR